MVMMGSMQWARSVGLSDGLRPNDFATREEVITMLRGFDILYRIAWAEARGEDEKGIVLVTNVIINRVNSPQFPNTIRDVIFQPNQFTPVINGAFERATPDERIRNAVHRALRGEDYSPQGALFFRAVRGAEGSWHERTLTRLFDHGGHRFYK